MFLNPQYKLTQHFLFIISISLTNTAIIEAAEWKTEPSVFIKSQYNDNVRMRSDNSNPESSTGFTLEPRLKLAGEEINLWDMAIDARGKITRFQDIEDGDSENIFFVFDGGRQTERTNWRLNTSYERNSNFDTDFDTENSDAGLLLDDHTEQETISILPSVKWSMSEISQLSVSLNSIGVAYDEVTNLAYQDYDYDSIVVNAYWVVSEVHQLGFTSTYSDYDSPGASFSYEQAIFEIDYTYKINQISDIGLSVGGRRLDSTLTNGQIVGCEQAGEFEALGQCVFSAPILADITSESDGTVVNISYNSKTELVSHSFTAGRTVSPSSFGGAQEIRSANYQLKIDNTERFSTHLILDTTETETVSGVDSSNDRVRYRVEPSVNYKLSKNWNLNLMYRFIDQNISNSDEDSTSNAIFLNLYLHWPKLATTY